MRQRSERTGLSTAARRRPGTTIAFSSPSWYIERRFMFAEPIDA